MDGRSKRNTWLACPRCGHKAAKVKTCDIEIKCKNCGQEFEAIVHPYTETSAEETPKPHTETDKKTFS